MLAANPCETGVVAGLFLMVQGLDGFSEILHAARASAGGPSSRNRAQSRDVRERAVNHKPTEPYGRRIEIQIGCMVKESRVVVASTEVQQKGRRDGAVVVQTSGPSGDECASIRADLQRQAIRAAERRGNLAFRVVPRPVEG